VSLRRVSGREFPTITSGRRRAWGVVNSSYLATSGVSQRLGRRRSVACPTDEGTLIRIHRRPRHTLNTDPSQHISKVFPVSLALGTGSASLCQGCLDSTPLFSRAKLLYPCPRPRPGGVTFEHGTPHLWHPQAATGRKHGEGPPVPTPPLEPGSLKAHAHQPPAGSAKKGSFST
jgi:hypothetical protein